MLRLSHSFILKSLRRKLNKLLYSGEEKKLRYNWFKPRLRLRRTAANLAAANSTPTSRRDIRTQETTAAAVVQSANKSRASPSQRAGHWATGQTRHPPSAGSDAAPQSVPPPRALRRSSPPPPCSPEIRWGETQHVTIPPPLYILQSFSSSRCCSVFRSSINKVPWILNEYQQELRVIRFKDKRATLWRVIRHSNHISTGFQTQTGSHEEARRIIHGCQSNTC